MEDLDPELAKQIAQEHDAGALLETLHGPRATPGFPQRATVESPELVKRGLHA